MYQLLKRLSIFFLFIIMISHSTITYAEEVIIQVNNLNLRSGPGLTYDVIGQVNQGEDYPLIENQKQWVQINYKGNNAWVAMKYVKINKPDQKTTDDYKNTDNVSTIYDNTNLRNLPSTEGKIVGIIPKGTKLLVEDTTNNWVKTKWEGIKGYVPVGLVTDMLPSQFETHSNLKGKVIVLDAGHGGRDVGATGASNTHEKDHTIQTALNIKYDLEQLGAIVHLTRSNDKFISLTARAIYANHLQADAFLSIHYNSTPQHPNANGISTYYYDKKDQLFAKSIHEELLKTTNSKNRSVQFGDFQVLRTNHTPALLLELGFISNTTEELQIQRNTYQKKISRGIIAGMQKYFLTN
ncbi:N-acetylmuramoyl-L-alanine amidase AmiC precursor [Paraliobacillus sp. PM-2]|uniref:N-acetylmuramoyl-L-alanine amidase n=1 Tax=Paraliobacillus sp. PM-2 TaxID=1462524 RepID=UPI00061C13D5|nr:N-acetylmuramoyl-L-alanine amidase [Paraliobacillus sp. PM-2]CQR46943.1 N-acetylmuramoyl-L-alanine amidase AmiC precursor [Paraliobacillus sp. PM-2]